MNRHLSLILLALFCVASFAIGGIEAHAANPIGNFESVSCPSQNVSVFNGQIVQGKFRGWACDLDNPNTPVEVHLYLGAYEAGGQYLGKATANLWGEPAIGAYCGGQTARRWEWDPTAVTALFGGDKQIYAYGINIGAGENALLSSSPKVMNCPINGVCGSIAEGLLPEDIFSVPDTSWCNAGRAGPRDVYLSTDSLSTTGQFINGVSNAYQLGRVWQCDSLGDGASPWCRAYNSPECGDANNTANVTSAPTDPTSGPKTNLCKIGTPSAVTNTGTKWEWTCNNPGATPASCKAYQPLAVVNGECGSAKGVSTCDKPTTGLCRSGIPLWNDDQATDGEFNWTCKELNGGTPDYCTAPKYCPYVPPTGGGGGGAPQPPSSTPGSCGTANGQGYSIPFGSADNPWRTVTGHLATLCGYGGNGSAYGMSEDGGTFRWSCSGYGAGVPAQCSAAKIPNSCGPANGVISFGPPSTGLCTEGRLATWLDSQGADRTYNWTCPSTGTYPAQSCSAPRDTSSQNGVCGTSNGTVGTTRPSSNLCTQGTSAWTDSMGGDGTWNWSCSGSGAGVPAQCSATNAGAIDGQDPQCATRHYECTVGNSINTKRIDSSYEWNCTLGDKSVLCGEGSLGRDRSISLTAANPRPILNQKTSLSWTPTGSVQNCKLYIAKPRTAPKVLVASVASQQSGYSTVNIDEPTKYSIVCDDGVSDEVTIIPGVYSVPSAQPSDQQVFAGDPFTITLDAWHAASCSYRVRRDGAYLPPTSGTAWTPITDGVDGWTVTTVSPTQKRYTYNNPDGVTLVNATRNVYRWNFECTSVHESVSRASVPASIDMTIDSGAARRLPTVDAGPDRTIRLPIVTTTLDGTISDPDLWIAYKRWVKVPPDAPGTITTPEAEDTGVTLPATPGEYTFRLVVRDRDMNWLPPSDATDVKVTVEPEFPFTNPDGPDLQPIALDTPAGPLTQGTEIMLSGQAYNAGKGDTGRGFTNEFTYGYGTGGRQPGSWSKFPGNEVTKPSLAPGTRAEVDTVRFTPPATGSLYIQYCVDSKREIPEGGNNYEINNCRTKGPIQVNVNPLAPEPPTSFRASPGACGGQIALSWVRSSDATSYELSRDGMNTWINVGNVDSYTYTTGLTPGATYNNLYIRAKNDANLYSSPVGPRNTTASALCGKPDIWSTNTSPTSGQTFTAAQSISFMGTAQNGPTVPVVQGGWAGVEIDWNSDGAGAEGTFDVYLDAYSGAQLGAFSPNQSKQLTRTLGAGVAPAGTHRYRFNVDTTDLLDESNEDNRSGWSTFTVGAVPGAPNLLLEAIPPTINTGDRSELVWTVSGTADSCWAGGGWSGWKAFTPGVHREWVSPGVKTKYTLECWNSGATSGKREVEIDVRTASNPPSNPPSTDCLAINIRGCTLPSTPVGGTAGSCISGYTGSCSYTCVSGPKWDENSNGCAPARVTQFTVCDSAGTCANPGETLRVPAGAPLTITWNSTNADFCTEQSGAGFDTQDAIRGTDAANAPSRPNTAENYTIACGNNGSGSDFKTVIVQTNPAGPDIDSPRVVDPGTAVQITWNVGASNPASCTITGPGISFTPTTNAGSITPAPVINSKSTFTIDCGPGLSDSVTIEIRPGIWET